MDRLITEHEPDVLIVEPVGSCTDLVATVLIPLMKHYPTRFFPAPYSVMIDGVFLNKAVSGSETFPFSQDVLYLYGKAKARLGRYNSTINLQSQMVFDPNDLMRQLLEGISALVETAGSTIAHLKPIGECEGRIIKASVVMTGGSVFPCGLMI